MESLMIASWVVVIDFLVTISLLFIVGAFNLFFWTSSFLFLEFGIMLVIGGCFMAREPLHEEDRYNEHGEARLAWRVALVGQQLLGAAVFILAISGIIYLFGYLI